MLWTPDHICLYDIVGSDETCFTQPGATISHLQWFWYR